MMGNQALQTLAWEFAQDVLQAMDIRLDDHASLCRYIAAEALGTPIARLDLDHLRRRVISSHLRGEHLAKAVIERPPGRPIETVTFRLLVHAAFRLEHMGGATSTEAYRRVERRFGIKRGAVRNSAENLAKSLEKTLPHLNLIERSAWRDALLSKAETLLGQKTLRRAA